MQERHPSLNESSRSYLTAGDLQRLIRVDKSTIYRMAGSGRLPAVKVGRQWRFPPDAVRRWLEGEQAGGGEMMSPGSSPMPANTQALVSLFADLHGVMVIATDMEGRPVVPVVNACGLFDAVAAAPDAIERCVDEWRGHAADNVFEPRMRRSHLGMLCARALVRRGNELVGQVFAGGIAPDDWPPTDDELAEIAAFAGVDPDMLRTRTDEVYRLDPAGQKALLRGLSMLGVHLSRSADTTLKTDRYQRSLR
jgi:excisionase family DNA binding protein